MKLMNNILYLTFGEMVECGVSEKYLSKAKSIGTRCWHFVSDPTDRRKVLVDYSRMKPMYQKMVHDRYGNPYDHLARQPILDMVKTDWAAYEFYKRHMYDTGGTGKYLPIAAVNKYARAAGWLGMLAGIDKQMVKAHIGISLAEFYKHCGELIAMERERSRDAKYEGMDVLPGDFPATYQRLLARVAAFVYARYNGGNNAAYELLLDNMLGNKAAAKMGKQCANVQMGECDNEMGNVVVPVSSGKVAAANPARETSPDPSEGGEVSSGKSLSPLERGRGAALRNISPPKEGLGEVSRDGFTRTTTTPKPVNKPGAFDPELYERQMAVIRAIAAKHNNFDAAQVTEMANMIFSLNNWNTVKVGTVRAIIKKNAHLLTAGRRGKRTHDNTIAMQVRRRVTELPLLYWTLDGWTVELMYKEDAVCRGSLQEAGSRGREQEAVYRGSLQEAGTVSRKPERGAKSGGGRVVFGRLVVVIVLDAWMKYPVGYAIGERETPALIREANRNALLHVRELFGGMYRPVQVQSDNYQIKNLTPFYQAMARLHTPTAVGNAKSKIVEPYFKYLNKTYCQKLPNWTGFNINASKKNQVNTEMLDKIKNTFPDKQGVAQQIERIVERERGAKRAEYVSTWAELPQEHKHTMTVQEWLEVFGEPLGKTNRIKGEGLVKRIAGAEYVYDSFDPDFRANMHMDWQIVGDVTDLSKVLAVSVDGRMKIVLEQKRILPMDVTSTTAEDIAYRQRITAFNKKMQQDITELYGRDADIAREVINNTPLDPNNEDELALKLMLTYNGQQKERLQDAKGLLLMDSEQEAGAVGRKQGQEAVGRMQEQKVTGDWEAMQERRMDSVVDFSVFQ